MKREQKKKFLALSPAVRTARNMWRHAIECVIRTIKSKKNISVDYFKLTDEQVQENKRKFKNIHKNIKKSIKVSDLDMKIYDRVIYISSMQDLHEWNSQILNEIDQEFKQSNKKGWFQLFSSWKKTDLQVTQSSEPEELILPSDYAWLEFEFCLHSGYFSLSKNKIDEADDFGSIRLLYQELKVYLSQRVIGSDISLSIQDLSLVSDDLVSKVTLISKFGNSKNSLIFLNYSSKPPNSDATAKLRLESEAIDLNFQSKAVNRLISFFLMLNVQEKVKTAAWDKLQEIQDSTQETLTDLFYKQNRFEISVKTFGLRIKLPSRNGWFLVVFGQFSVESKECTNENYAEFLINLASLETIYEKYSESITLVPSFCISGSLLYLKSKIKESKWKQKESVLDALPDIILNGQIPKIRAKFSPSIYNQVLNIADILNLEIDFANTIHLDKKDIIKNSKIITKLRKQGNNIQTWTQFIGILSGAYIYFFINDKEPIATTYYYIKDCSITEIPNLSNSILLQNRFGVCVLSFFKEKEYEKWIKALSDQIFKFQTNKSVAKTTTQKDYKKKVFEVALNIKTISIKLCNEDGISISELEIGNLTAKSQGRSYDMSLNASLMSLTVRDLQRHSSSIRFNTFARSIDETAGIIDLSMEYYSFNSPLYNDEDILLDLKVGKCEINWNPDIISSTLSFFTFAEYSDPNHKKPLRVGILQPNHVLLKTKIWIENIKVYLNNVQKQISLAEISMQGTDTCFIVKNGGYSWTGVIGNLVLNDLTNYPRTVLMEKVQPFKLFSVKEQSKSLLEFDIFIYGEDNPEKPKDLSSKVTLELDSVSIVYLHQPFMRIIDYISYKVIGVFDAQTRVKDINHWSPIYKLSYLLNLPTIQSLKSDEDLMQETKSFSAIKISMKNPMITLVPRPHYPEYFIVDLGNISISNSPGYESQGKNEIWLDIYTINFHQLNIISSSQKVAKDFDMTLTIERPVLTSKQAADPDIDKKYKIIGKCETIKYQLSHEDYRLVLKLMDLNFTYDDQLENYINPEYCPYVYSNEPGHGGVFFKLIIEYNVLSILLSHEDQIISELLACKSLFEMIKFNDYSSDINFKCLHFIGLISEEMIGDNNESELDENIKISDQIFNIPINSVLQSYKTHAKLSKVLFGPLAESDKTESGADKTGEDQSGFVMDFKGDPEGSKNIIIKFAQVRINFHITVIKMLQNFFYYGFPDYSIEEETPYDYMDKYKPSSKFVKKTISTEYLAPKILVNLCITNPIMLLPTCNSNRVVVAQTDVNYMYLREKEEKNFNSIDKAGEIKYILHQLELYTCRLEELISKSSFLAVQKRRILEPAQLFYECVTKRPEKFSYIYEITYEIDKLIFTLSHRDILLLDSVRFVQEKILANKSKLIESLSVYPKESQCESISLNIKTANTINFSGINILIINDALGAYSPIIDYNCQATKICMSASVDIWKLFASLSMRINYYNPQIDTWEPFVEMFTVSIDINNSNLANPQNQMIVILDEKMPFNVNFTEAMIKHLQIVLESWQHTTLGKGNELVSPISIYNKTGCNIVVSRVTPGSGVRESLEVPQLKIKSFEIDSTEIRALDFSKETLRICIDSYPDIEKIHINKLTSISREILDVYAIIEIKLLDTKKLLTVKSEFCIINETDFSFALKFSNETDSVETMCKPGMESPVPLPFTRSKIGFKPLQYIDKHWIEFDLLDFIAKNSGECREIRIDDFYFLLVFTRDPVNPKEINLKLKAPILISNYLPCEMTLQIFYNNFEIRELNILPNESYKEYTTSVNSNLECSLKIPNFNFSERQSILYKNRRPPKHILLKDSYDDALNVYIYYKHDYSHMFNFYAPVVFINNTSIPIIFYYKKTTTKIVAGQTVDNSITIGHSTKKVRISIGKNKSKSFKIGTVGIKNVIQFLGDVDSEGFQTRYQFLYEILLARVINDELLFTKVLIISPRYILINSLEEDLIIQQYNTQSSETLLARRSKEPFHWPDAHAEELLKLKLGCGEWNWSGAFSISNIGAFTVQCQQSSFTYKLIKIEIKLQESTAYVLFSEENELYSSYRIENLSHSYALIVFQDGCRDESRKIDVKSVSSFAWSQILLNHELIVDFYTGSFLGNCVKNDCKFKFPLDEMNIIYKIPMDEENTKYVYGRTFHEGSTKVLQFTDTPISKEKKREVIISQKHIILHKFGISIIEQYENSICEILYCSASSLTILHQSTKVQNKTEILVKSFQIDNQYNFNAIYPVLMCPSDPAQEVINIVALSFVDENPNCIHFEKVSVTVQPLTLNLESWIVRKILEMVGRVAKQNSPVYDAMVVYKSYKSPTWTRIDPILQIKNFYIASMEIRPIKLVLSFVPLKEENNGSDSFSTVARALGMAITAIDSVPVKLYSAEMNDVFGTRGQILAVIWMHYRAQLASEIFTLIGHAEILGNPIGLLNNLGTGVVDFLYEPVHGVIKGPIGIGKGLIRGTGSLLKNTVQGTFGTVSKLANTFSTAITLTQDKEYLSSRQREKMNKPKNVVDGVGMGFKVFFSNLGKGIAGVITEPIKGYKKKKTKGLFIGGAKGLSGLLIKPIAGVLDAASKAAEGVKNTADVFNKSIIFQRSRVPRTFYGDKSFIKPYNEYDSQVLFFMNQIKKGLFIKEKFYAQSAGKDIRGEKLVCVLYLNKFVLADIRTKKVLWIVDVNSINTFNIIDHGILLGTSPSTYKNTKNKQSFLIPFPAPEIKTALFTRIKELVKIDRL
jgi:Vacuolar-sorting-associated 13 protein C-terminal/SHR-binding domain of vacuolar-sorting associated protein 13/Autophagy-related protein C terminal domain